MQKGRSVSSGLKKIAMLQLALLGEEHVAGLLQRAGDGALLLGGEPGVLAREDFAGVSDIAAHHLRGCERDLLRSQGLLLRGFGRAHVENSDRPT